MYLDSPKGKEMVEKFTIPDDCDDLFERLCAITDFAGENLSWHPNELGMLCLYQCVCAAIEDGKLEEIEDDDEYFAGLLDNFEYAEWDLDGEELKKGKPFFKKDDFRRIATLMPYISLALYAYYGSGYFYYPVLFSTHYDFFEKCCQLLGIDLPPVPLQKNKEERCWLMPKICICLDDFRLRHDITKEEMCAMLYGYAADEVREMADEPIAELAAPTRIWLTGASKGDYDYFLKDIKNAEDKTSVWACHEETKRGDIVIIYAMAPKSCIHSVWRAVRDCNANPFDYYTNRIKVGQPIVVPPIGFHELKADEYMKNVPIVRRNLQGINGIELQLEDYKELQRMFAEKGFDCTVLPQIEAPVVDYETDVELEGEMSAQILIPHLTKLGYSDQDGEDWVRELVLKLGRDREAEEQGIKGRPDFTFFPKDNGYSQISAPFVIECKYEMKNSSAIKEAFGQGASYARQLNAKMLGICDKHRLRLYQRKRDIINPDGDLIFDHTWGEIATDTIFYKLKKLIGKDAILKLDR